MSLPLFKNDILFYQRILAVSGYYKGPLDGKWRDSVEAASLEFDAETAANKVKFGSCDVRSETNIVTMLPKAQVLARQFMKLAANYPFTVKILSGTRSYSEQDALYAIGRTVQMNRQPVTKAKGGQSNHNFSIAWDVGLFGPNGNYLTGDTKAESKAYADLASLILAALPALEWGGNWKSFPDLPHYQVKTGLGTTSKVRAKFEAGTPYI